MERSEQRERLSKKKDPDSQMEAETASVELQKDQWRNTSPPPQMVCREVPDHKERR